MDTKKDFINKATDEESLSYNDTLKIKIKKIPKRPKISKLFSEAATKLISLFRLTKTKISTVIPILYQSSQPAIIILPNKNRLLELAGLKDINIKTIKELTKNEYLLKIRGRNEKGKHVSLQLKIRGQNK